MIATTIEQSRRLLELGLDPKTADMYYLPQVMNEGETLWPIDEGYDLDDADQPAWSLAALLEVMKEYGVDLSSLFNGFRCICSTYDTELYDNPIDAAYEMVCWLLEQKILTFNNNEKD